MAKKASVKRGVARPKAAPATGKKEKPFGLKLTVYLIGFMTLASILLTAYSYSGLSAALPPDSVPGALAFTLVILTISVAINLVLGWGLWNQKNWARIIYSIVVALAVLGNIFSLLLLVLNPAPASEAYAQAGLSLSPAASVLLDLLWLAVYGVILYFLWLDPQTKTVFG